MRAGDALSPARHFKGGIMFLKRKQAVVTYGAIRLACRGECHRVDMDGIESPEIATRLGWCDITKVAPTLTPFPHRWWTHLGICPQCQERWEIR